MPKPTRIHCVVGGEIVLKVSVYVGSRGTDGQLRDIRKWEDINENERKHISNKLQEQCATALGYKKVD